MSDEVETWGVDPDKLKTEYPRNTSTFELSVSVRVVNQEELMDELSFGEGKLYATHTEDIRKLHHEHPDTDERLSLYHRRDVTKDIVCLALEVAIPKAVQELKTPEEEDVEVVKIRVREKTPVRKYSGVDESEREYGNFVPFEPEVNAVSNGGVANE